MGTFEIFALSFFAFMMLVLLPVAALDLLGPEGRKELLKDIKDRLCFWQKKDKEREG